MYQEAVEVNESCGNLFRFSTGHIFSGGVLPQYHNLIDLHVGERHMVYSLLDDLNLGRRDFVSWV